MSVHLLLLILAFISFVAAALGFRTGQLTAGGLCLLTLAELIGAR